MKTKGRRVLTAGLAVVIAGSSVNVPYATVQAENTYAATPYVKNIDDQISAYTSKYTEFKALEKVNDGKYADTETTKSVKLWTKDVETDESFAVKSIKVYAEQNSFTSVTVNAATKQNTNDAFEQVANFTSLEWKTDTNGSYVELPINENYLSYGYELVFNQNAAIKEVDVTGVYFKTNLFDGAEVTYNQKPFAEKDARGMLDNSVLSNSTFADNKGQGQHEIMISSNDGTAYAIDKLFLSANYMEKQGPKPNTVKVSYWENGAWQEAEASVENNVASGKEQRRQMLVVNLPHKIVSSQIKLNMEFNTEWKKGIISEVNAIGEKVPSAEAVAELVKIDPLTAGNKRLTFSNLDKIVKNWEEYFTISVASTSNTNAVRADGTVNHTGEDQTSNVTLLVKNKATGETATTQSFAVTVPHALAGNKTQADLQIDYTTAYKNPAMGWVAYITGFECTLHEKFAYNKPQNEVTGNWNARNKGLCQQVGSDAASAQKWIDQMNELMEEGMPCNIVYIREPWSWFEPTENQYAWNDPNSACHAIVNWAREKNVQLAFRVITCSSATGQQATPQWVFDAGATGVKRNHEYVKNATDPYLDDAVFKEKFKKLVDAMGEEFNNNGTAFIDAHGHGQWGEMNAMVDVKGDKNKAIQYLEDCFVEAFPDVLLGGQQGSSQGKDAIIQSFDVNGKNFVVRRDAFGSKKYLRDSGNAAQIRKYRFEQGIPLFAENCYSHFDSRNFRWSKNIAYSNGRTDMYGGDNPFVTMRDMMDQVVFDAIDLGANTIDLRALEDAKLWMRDGRDFLDEFTQEGGYRISVDDAIFTNKVKQGEELTVESSWVNNGNGIVPNNNKRWGKKMKVAFALIDEEGKIAQREIVSTDDINVGNFEKDSKGDDYTYNTTFRVDETLSGTYKLAVAVVDEKENHDVGIQLANKGETTNGGYLTLGTVEVSQDALPVNAAPTIQAADKTITVGNAFDVMAGVTAEDEEDGNLTPQIKVVKNDVDTQKAGTYEVTYKVTDSRGASATKTITVTVEKKDEEKPGKPEQPDKPNKPDKPEQPDKPNKPGQSAPETSDTGRVGLLSYLFAVSGVLAGAMFFGKHRRKDTED